ncbi:MAG: leucine-rich repeat domain-containing protein [Promethearchaeota archaeon]
MSEKMNDRDRFHQLETMLGVQFLRSENREEFYSSGSDVFFEGENLKFLSLGILKNPLRKIPSIIGEFKDLEKLILNMGDYREISTFIFNLKHLDTLKIRSHSEITIEGDISKLTNLTELLLDSRAPNGITNFTELDKIGNLKKMEYLTLRSGNMKSVPNFIKKLINLKYLCLHSFKIEKIPPWLSDLINLKIIELGNTNIRNFPNDLLTLTPLSMILPKELMLELMKNTRIKNWFADIEQRYDKILA